MYINSHKLQNLGLQHTPEDAISHEPKPKIPTTPRELPKESEGVNREQKRKKNRAKSTDEKCVQGALPSQGARLREEVPEWYLGPAVHCASETADDDAEAGLLQDVHVVVVGVAHGPS